MIMKKNSIIIILIAIIIGLLIYIIYDKNTINKSDVELKENLVEVIEKISLEYINIYLADDGHAYISPLNEEEIENLTISQKLKENLLALYERAFYFDVYVGNYKIKGFRIKLDNDIEKIRKVIIDNKICIVFIKKNHTIGLFNYDKYYNQLNVHVIDNYNNLKNVSEINNQEIIYLDGRKENIKNVI